MDHYIRFGEFSDRSRSVLVSAEQVASMAEARSRLAFDVKLPQLEGVGAQPQSGFPRSRSWRKTRSCKSIFRTEPG